MTLKKNNKSKQCKVIKYPYDYEIESNDIILVDIDTKKKINKYKLEEGIAIAKEKNLNLIQISFNNNIAICIIESYSKYIYQELKKEKNRIKKQKAKKENKEVTITNIIDLTDMLRKLQNIIEYVVLKQHSVTLTIKQKREGLRKTLCFSNEFIFNYLKSSSKISYKIITQNEKLIIINITPSNN